MSTLSRSSKLLRLRHSRCWIAIKSAGNGGNSEARTRLRDYNANAVLQILVKLLYPLRRIVLFQLFRTIHQKSSLWATVLFPKQVPKLLAAARKQGCHLAVSSWHISESKSSIKASCLCAGEWDDPISVVTFSRVIEVHVCSVPWFFVLQLRKIIVNFGHTTAVERVFLFTEIHSRGSGH